MASRWTTSGIDWLTWTNPWRLDQVVKELYLAYRERKAVVEYYKSSTVDYTTTPGTPISPGMEDWEQDITDNPIRTEVAVKEMLQGLHDWLDFNPVDGEPTQSFWADHNVTADGTAEVTGGRLLGLSIFTSEAGEAFETLVGLDLSLIRDIETTAEFRIDRDVIDLIYSCLINLKVVHCNYVPNDSTYGHLYMSFNIFKVTDNKTYNGFDNNADYSACKTQFNADSGTPQYTLPAAGEYSSNALGYAGQVELFNQVSAPLHFPLEYTMRQKSLTLGEYKVVDSKGVTILGSSVNLKVYNLGISSVFGNSPLPPLLPDLIDSTWTYSNANHELNVYPHPYAFIDLAQFNQQHSQAFYHSAQAEINKAACIEYYTP